MQQTTRGWRERWPSFWLPLPRAVERLGRAASWNLVAEESSSVRADACRDGWRGSLMDANPASVLQVAS